MATAPNSLESHVLELLQGELNSCTKDVSQCAALARKIDASSRPGLELYHPLASSVVYLDAVLSPRETYCKTMTQRVGIHFHNLGLESSDAAQRMKEIELATTRLREYRKGFKQKLAPPQSKLDECFYGYSPGEYRARLMGAYSDQAPSSQRVLEFDEFPNGDNSV